MLKRYRKLACAAATVGAVGACAGTRTVALSPAPRFGAGQRVVAWLGDSSRTLRRVRVDADTLRAVRDGCDSCQVVIPVQEVDSLTTRSGNEWLWAVPVGAAAAVMLVWRATDSD